MSEIYEEYNKESRKKKFFLGLTALGAGGVLIRRNMNSSGGSGGTGSNSITEQSNKNQQIENRQFEIGTEDDALQFNVNLYDTYEYLEDEDSNVEVISSYNFVVIEIDIKNNHKHHFNLTKDAFSININGEHYYPKLRAFEFLLYDNRINLSPIFFTLLKSGDSISGSMLFDVPIENEIEFIIHENEEFDEHRKYLYDNG